MKETTKYHLQAIGSIAGEIRDLNKNLNSFVELQIKQTELLRDFHESLDEFKDRINTRFTALQIAWDKQLQNSLFNQECMIKRLIQKNLIEPLLPKKPKKPIKKVLKKKGKK